VYETAVQIVPSDANDVEINVKAFYVGGVGDVCVRLHGGQTVTLVGVLVGHIYPLHVQRVFATGTTATNLVGLGSNRNR